MTDATTAPFYPPANEPDNPPLRPEFQIAVFDDGEGNVSTQVDFLTHPSIKRHASNALVYGLAIMTLDQQGVIDAMVESLLADGAISEIDASNRLTLLLQQEANVEPA